MCIGEDTALRGEAVDVGGLYFGGAVAAYIAVAEVVDVNDDYIGLFVRCLPGGDAAGGEYGSQPQGEGQDAGSGK